MNHKKKRKKVRLFLIIAAAFLIFSSCAYVGRQDLQPEFPGGNADDIIYSAGRSESELVLINGELVVSEELQYYLDQQIPLDGQRFAVIIMFCSNEYVTFIEDRYERIYSTVRSQFDGLREQLDKPDKDPKKAASISKQWNDLDQKVRDEVAAVRYDAFETYFKPILPLIEEAGINTTVRDIYFIQDNNIWTSETYCVSCISPDMIDNLRNIVSGQDFGLGIALAPEFLWNDSQYVQITEMDYQVIE